jgi:hypothetical protein
MLRWNMNRGTLFLGLPDVYAADVASGIDRSASQQCTALRGVSTILVPPTGRIRPG